MLIIQRYYLKDFFKVFGVLGAGLAVVFSLLELINRVDELLPYKPSFGKLLLYTLYNFPKNFLYLLPLAVLLCSLFIFSQAIKREEITAIRAAGGKLKELLRPFLVCGLLLSLFGFFLAEIIVPEASKRSLELKEKIMKKDKSFSFKEGTVWLMASGGTIVKIGFYYPEKNFSRNVSIFKLANGGLQERIEAEEGEWIEGEDKGSGQGRMKLKKVIVYDMQNSSVKKYDEMDYPMAESPSVFAGNILKPEDMGIIGFYKYTKKLEEAGFKNLKLTVDLNSRVAYPLINFFMIMLGISLPMAGRMGGGLVTTAIGIGISLAYWFSHAMFLSMGYTGILPPFVSAWTIPSVFCIVAIALFRKIHE
ncbi:MAG: LptF/LptG family permease [Nitrospiraceae bacterium]|nr:LptF/LptG family permease [Nitrospiraceae bacterium]